VERRIAFLQKIKEKESNMSETLQNELHRLKSRYPQLRKKLQRRFENWGTVFKMQGN
jgi:prefoldin subunit 5